MRLLDRVCKDAGLKSRRERLRQAGMISLDEMTRRAKVNEMKIVRWRQAGQLVGYRSNYRNEYLYPQPSPELIAKLRKKQRRENANQ